MIQKKNSLEPKSLKIVGSCGSQGCEAPHEKVLPKHIAKVVVMGEVSKLKKAI